MNLQLVGDKLWNIMRRDLLTALRYRHSLWVPLISTVAELAAFYYLARAVGAQYRPEGMAYYPYLMVGTGLYRFFIAGISAFVETVREAQQSGTLEVLMTTSTSAPELVLLSAFSSFAGGAVNLALYLAGGVLLFGVRIPGVNILSCLLVFLLSLAVSVAIRIFAAAVQVALYKGNALLWLFGSVAWFLTGVMFPIAVLPLPLRLLSRLLPFTYSLHGLRLAFIVGTPAGLIAPDLLILLLFTGLLLPASLTVFSFVLRRARLEGTLSAW